MNEQNSKSKDNKNSAIIRRGRLTGAQRNRLEGLLDMMYTTNELASEIGVSARLIRRVHVSLGCPHQRNRKNHIMINGVSFRSWYLRLYQKRSPRIDEAFCLTCKDVVKMDKASSKELNGLSYKVATCPNCGRSVARFMDMDRTKR